MAHWLLLQFAEVWSEFIGQCDEEMREVLEQRLDYLREHGNQAKMPVSKPLGRGIFELRAKTARHQARLLYFFLPNRRIVFATAFFKKSRAVPQPEIEKAQQIKKLVTSKPGGIHGIPIKN